MRYSRGHWPGDRAYAGNHCRRHEAHYDGHMEQASVRFPYHTSPLPMHADLPVRDPRGRDFARDTQNIAPQGGGLREFDARIGVAAQRRPLTKVATSHDDRSYGLSTAKLPRVFTLSRNF